MSDRAPFPIHFYVKGADLGKGVFGKVKRWDKRPDAGDAAKAYPASVAVKKLRKEENYELKVYQARELYVNEATAGGDSGHQHIVLYHGHITLDEELFGLIMEVGQGPLTKLVNSRELIIKDVAFLMRQLLMGLEHLHKNKIIHRDIKPDNILLFTRDGQIPNWATVPITDLTLKITDFGLSRSFESESGSMTMSATGTIQFMAPEVRQAMMNQVAVANYNKSVDIYSSGMVAYYMLKKKTLLGPNQQDKLASDESLKEGGFDIFLSQMLQDEKERRPTAADLLKHNFLMNN